MEEKNKRKGIIYLTIGVVTLLILVAGAAYAYFQAQSGEGKSADLNATTGTTDNLTFAVSDINVSENNSTNVVDEEETEAIIINATQDNFGQDDKTIGDGVNGKATLLANSTSNLASMNYNVYFVIKENNFTYTTGETKTPEVILKVYAPNGTEVKNIEGLSYHNADSSNSKDISGFDITGRTGAFAIESGHTIATETGKKEEEWKVEVYLINLPTDQLENTGKTITGEVKITTTEEKTYKVAQINTITPETTSNSIEATVKLEEGATNEVTKYYFAIENKGEVETVALSEKTKSEIEDWKEETVDHHTFNDLEDNTNYIIYSYVVDSEGFESSLYETEIIATDIELPKITKAEVTTKTYNSITVEVKEKTMGSLSITGYEYEISGEGIDTPRIEQDSNTTHTFDKLQDNTEYTIEVRAVDSSNNKSADYKITATTDKKTCNEGETIQACLTRLDKEQNPSTPTLIFHNGSDANDANDQSYRYSGATGIVNNYVCFGSSLEECPEENKYRIIGLFKNNSEQYEMKIIKATPATPTQLGTDGAYTGSGNYYYWNSKKTGEYEGKDTNDWSKSPLNTENLNGYYLNTYLQNKDSGKWNNMITEHTWTTAGNTSNNINKKMAKEAYTNEITSPSVGTALSSAAPEVTAKVGLMYVSDYGYAAYKEAWTTKTLFNYDDATTKANNWMYMNNSTNEWTITRSADYSNHAFYVGSSGYVSYGTDVCDGSAVRPVLYLNSSVKISSGEGTSEKPYVLSGN